MHEMKIRAVNIFFDASTEIRCAFYDKKQIKNR